MRGLIRRAVVVTSAVMIVSGAAAGVASASGAPVLTWSPTTSAGTFAYNPPVVTVGSSKSQTFTLKNAGGVATSMLTITLTGSAAFSIPSGGNGCAGTSLGPNKTCQVTVVYKPASAGQADTATLTATSKKPNATGILRAVGYAEAVAPGRPLRLAYADPPYPGKARLYRDHPDYGGEVNHAALIGRLAAYDGWAISTSTQALPAVLALCPPGFQVAAWHRGERPTRSRWPLHAWEPILFHGGRQLVAGQRRVDSLVCGVRPLDTLPGRAIGAKPASVCRWIFTMLGAAPGDTLDDLFRFRCRYKSLDRLHLV